MGAPPATAGEPVVVDAPPEGRGRVGWRRAATVLAVVAVAGGVVSVIASGGAPRPNGPAVPGLTFGVTHTQESVDPWNPAAARASAGAVLSDTAPLQNQSLMGWGADNPEPSPGRYAWGSLDQRIGMIEATGSEPVLTLCCAPDWMKGGHPGTTDWDQIEVAPAPEHYADFAALAAAAAARYPQVRHFLVWNELKGFFDDARNDWDAAAYTDLYNAVYRAVKAVRPDAKVGGPYVVLDSWSSPSVTSHASSVAGAWGVLDQRPLDVLTYWLHHAVGADFVAVDGGTAPRDRGLVVPEFEATAKLVAATRWLRATTPLPIWWAEIYADTDDPSAPAGSPERAAVMADALVQVARAGASVALLWQPRASSSFPSAALFTSTATAGGGQPLPLAELLRFVGGALAEDPRSVTARWDPGTARFTLSTGGRQMSWSAATGLLGPAPVWGG